MFNIEPANAEEEPLGMEQEDEELLSTEEPARASDMYLDTVRTIKHNTQALFLLILCIDTSTCS